MDYRSQNNNDNCNCNNSIENDNNVTAQQQAPRFAPPDFSPPLPAWQDGWRGIRRCLNRNTFIWLWNGNSFWFYPVFMGRQRIAGFVWRRRFGWTFRTINLDSIRSFQCF